MSTLRHSNVQMMLTLLVIFLLGVCGWLFWKSTQNVTQSSATAEEIQEVHSLRAENQLMKIMLGQIEGSVTLLAPVQASRSAHGKAVWDESLQQGYFYAAHLEPGDQYHLVASAADGGGPVDMASFTPQINGRAAFAFQPSQRLLKLHTMQVLSADRSEVMLEGRPLGGGLR